MFKPIEVLLPRTEEDLARVRELVEAGTAIDGSISPTKEQLDTVDNNLEPKKEQ